MATEIVLLGGAVDATNDSDVTVEVSGTQIVEGNTIFVVLAGGGSAVNVVDDVRDERVLWDTHWTSIGGLVGGISQKTATADWPENPLPKVSTIWSPANGRKAMQLGLFAGNARSFYGESQQIFTLNGAGDRSLSMESLEFEQEGATLVTTLAIKLGNHPYAGFRFSSEGMTDWPVLDVPEPPAAGTEQRVMCTAWADREIDDRVVTFNIDIQSPVVNMKAIMTTAVFFDVQPS